jgi:TRAP-type C4-dicarboxylate transport system substrate-binding protein
VAPADAADFEWRVNINYVESREDSQAWKRMVERINERSEGRLVLTPYFGNALGFTQADSLRLIKQGAVEVTSAWPGYFSRDAPDFAAMFMTGLVSEPDVLRALYPTLQDLTRETMAEWGGVVIGWTIVPAADFHIMCKDPVNTLEELRTKKLRTNSKAMADTFARLDVAAQVIPQLDLYVALQTGVVDCALYGVGTSVTISLPEVTDYAVPLFPFTMTPTALVVPQQYWDELPQDLQQIVMEEGERAWQENLDEALDAVDAIAAEKAVVESGAVEMLPDFPDEDRLAIREAVEATWQERLQEVGGRGLDYHQRVTEALQKIRG